MYIEGFSRANQCKQIWTKVAKGPVRYFINHR